MASSAVIIKISVKDRVRCTETFSGEKHRLAGHVFSFRGSLRKFGSFGL